MASEQGSDRGSGRGRGRRGSRRPERGASARGTQGRGPSARETSGSGGRSRRHDHLALGRHGEDLVQRWYEDRGLTVLARNWRCPAGELDLVLRGGAMLVCCEVKTRSSTRFGSPLEAVDRRRVSRLRAAAAEFLRAERPRGIEEVRFDLAAVVGNRMQVVEAAF